MNDKIISIYKSERNVYQWAALIAFTMFLFTGYKYISLKQAYQQAETEKVQFCKENQQLKREVIAAENEAEKLFDLGLED